MPFDIGPTILVVDDERSIRKLARFVLERENYRVLEAPDGAEALRVMERDARIEVVISDLRMPVISGTQLGMAVRQLRPSMKILYLTGHADLLFEDRVVLGEDEAFLEKPFSTRGLIEAVSLLIEATDVQPGTHIASLRAGALTRWWRRVPRAQPASMPGQ